MSGAGEVFRIAATSQAVAATASRKGKIALLAELLEELPPDASACATSWLAGDLRQGRIGIGPAAVQEALDTAAADTPQLDVADAESAFAAIAAMSGPGSAAARAAALRELFGSATEIERDFLTRLLRGDLRQGALDGVMADAVARAAGIPAAAVRRAAQLTGDLATVTLAARTGGADALARFGVQLFRPLQPMLAQPAEDMADAMSRLGRAGLDYKLDGARVQVHRSGSEVRVYTRRLNDVTASLPELVERALTSARTGRGAGRRGHSSSGRRPAGTIPGDHVAVRQPRGRGPAAGGGAAVRVLLRLPVR
jgi:DNA ligase 1